MLEEEMPTRFVNLDALIIREDFEFKTEKPSLRETGDFKLTDLEEKSIIFRMLRKPDFQRETSSWSPEKIVQLIQNFLDDSLIPSIIMWRSPTTGNIFVIDGAHRLSALIAWVHDDYGDRNVSRAFFHDAIPEYQMNLGQETRELVKARIGTYENLKYLATAQVHAPPEAISRARNLALLPVALQWVRGDAANAETSFFTINQSATPIHPMEMRIITSRRKPNALAARAIMRAGAGHKYWARFSPPTQEQIENIAKQIHQLLFSPSLKEPIKSLNLPLAGPAHSGDSLSVVFEFIAFANDVKWEKTAEERRSKKKDKQGSIPSIDDDQDGTITLQYLTTAKSVADRLAGQHPGSLGLHPFVYVYTATGRFQPTAFFAVAALVRHLVASNLLREFTEIRSRFEEFLLAHRFFINAVARRFGSGTRGLGPLFLMYKAILEHIRNEEDDDAIVRALYANEQFRFLAEAEENQNRPRRRFSKEAKSTAFLREAKDSAMLCAICRARIPEGSITWDHIERQREGGVGTADNAQPSHPYCNTTYKN